MAQVPAQQSRIKGLDAIFPRPEVTDREAYSLGIRISRELDLVYFSGVTAYPPEIDPWNPGTFKVPADPAERSRMATENLDRLLKAAGATWEHIVFNVNYNAPGGDGINFRERTGTWSPCSTMLRVTDTGVPGVNTLYQITAVAPRKAITTAKGNVPGIEPIFHRPELTLRDVPAAPAIRVSSDVDAVYFSGVTAYPLNVDPWNPGTYKLPEDLAIQEKMVADNIDRMLKAAGITWQHIVLLVRTGEVSGLTAMRERMGDWRPCRTTRAVSTGIPGAKVLCEITAVAQR